MQKLNIPGFFFPHVEKFVNDRGGNTLALYEAAGLDPASFHAAQTWVSEEQFYGFIKEAAHQSAEPAFGLEIGRRFSIGSFGLMSRALMSCLNGGDALRLVERYSSLALPLVRFTMQEYDDFVVMETNVLSRYPDLNQIILEAIFTTGIGINKLLTGKDMMAYKYSYTFAEPKYAEFFKAYSPSIFEFGAERNLVFFKPEYLEVPFFTANPIDAETSKEQCEAELIKNQETNTLVDQVVDRIRFYLDINPSGKEIAQRLNLTERTMRRKLAEEGTNFRDLLQQVRQETAVYYLQQTQLQISQIALKLGYQETSNFRAAFKSWTGKSPRQWRQAMQEQY